MGKRSPHIYNIRDIFFFIILLVNLCPVGSWVWGRTFWRGRGLWETFVAANPGSAPSRTFRRWTWDGSRAWSRRSPLRPSRSHPRWSRSPSPPVVRWVANPRWHIWKKNNRHKNKTENKELRNYNASKITCNVGRSFRGPCRSNGPGPTDTRWRRTRRSREWNPGCRKNNKCKNKWVNF